MKRIIVCCLFVLSIMKSYAQDTAKLQVKGPLIEFAEDMFDFGDMIQGAKSEHIFKFKNSGTEPLLISEVVTTCGCTGKSWSREPILPGKTGELVISFNSKGKEGRQNKKITILSNSSINPVRIT